MPPRTSHPLQPLNVGCFAFLKIAYGRQVSELARQGVFHIDKLDFLYIFTKIRSTFLSEQHIKADFDATGLIPPCPDRVLSNLTVIRTPSPPVTAGDELAA
jgi:hypothetical protein